MLLGSGTATDPWHTAPPLSSCAAYRASFASATDGVYTAHPTTTDVGVYCDMTNGGITYEAFGIGPHAGIYAGWTRIGGPDLASAPQIDAAFAYLYTRDGLQNLAIGFTSGNCCLLDTNDSDYFGVVGTQYMEPAQGTTLDCNPTGGYTASAYEIFFGPPQSGVLASLTPAQVGNVTYSTLCAVSNNPGLFVKRY